MVEYFETLLKEINISLDNTQVEDFVKYKQLLLDWNERMNLTAITEEKEVVLKHFIDSLTIQKYIGEKAKIIDVGTGAGFPGIPIKICKNEVDLTLVDSLNKRILFLNDVIDKLDLQNIVAIHARAEELGKDSEYRECYDVATSRAVASLDVLVEYMLPFVSVGGIVICMKGSNIEEELENSKKAISMLGGKIETVESIILPNSDMQRNNIIIRKIRNTPSNFPRSAKKIKTEKL